MPTLVEAIQSLPAEHQRQAVTRIAGMTDEAARTLVAELIRDLLALCAADGWFWLQFVKTRDEADVESVKPFPRHKPDLCRPDPYQCFGCKLEFVWRALAEHQKVVIAKSRQMMVSWLMAAFCVWTARFQPHRAVYWQTQKEEDANGMVCLPVSAASAALQARMQFIERHLPAWMQFRDPAIRENAGEMVYPNGSVVEALAGGANQVRGKTASLIVEDEFAFQVDAKGVYGAVAPLIRGACKFVAVSTPNGTDNTFAELYHGQPMGYAA